MRIPTITAILAAALLSSASAQTGTFSVFLDNGSNAPDSTNTAVPFAAGDRDTTWNIMATAESGLAGFGAAAVQVRMVTFNINANSRSADTAGGNGLGISTGGNNGWMDSSVGQAAAFQFTFFSDVAMTTELTGLNIRFDSFTSRIGGSAIRQDLNAYAGSGALVYAAASPENDGFVRLGGTNMTLANDGALANLGSSTFMGEVYEAGAPQYFNITSTAINFGEEDTFWVRRRNETNPGTNAAYQVGELTFTVVPEPGSFAAIFGVMALGVVVLRRRAR